MGAITLQKQKVRSLYGYLMLLLVLFSGFMNLEPVQAAGGNMGTGQIWEDFDVKIQEKGVNVTGAGVTDSDSAWKKLLDKYRNLITGVAAIGAVTMVGLFIVNFLKLGASASNPQARSNAITGCIWTGIAAACLGSVAVITGIFYRAL